MIKLFEAFSGYGSQSLELKYLGIPFEHVGISEIDKYAIQAHEALHGPVKNYGDISKIKTEELPDMDLFTYSFPCQDISNAGKQRGLDEGSGTRSSLLWECQKVIETKRPMFLMMENVKNLVGKKNKPNFDKWLRTLEELGYNNYWKVINGKWCGVPQNRERVFCISIRKDVDNGMFSFYEDFDNGIRLKDILEKEVDEKYYLSDEKVKGLISKFKDGKQGTLPTEENTISRALSSREHRGQGWKDIAPTLCARDYKDPNVVYVKEATKKGYKEAYPGDSINLEHPKSKTRRGRVGDQIAQTGRVYGVDGIAPTLNTCGGGQREPKILEGCAIRGRYDNQGNTKQQMELNGQEISNALTTVQKDSMVLENQYRIRKLTPYECLILMGLSHEDAMKLINSGISNSQLYKMAGNSIITNCMRFFLKIYAIYILNEDKPKEKQLSLF